MDETEKRRLRVLAELSAAGFNAAEWAAANGFKRHTVYSVMKGHTKCSRGKTHAIAVALGLKDGTVIDSASYRPATNPQLRKAA